MAKGRKSQLTLEQRAKRDAAKRAKFVEFAPVRVEKALKAIRRIEHLGSANYIHRVDEAKAIVGALVYAVEQVELAFAGSKKDVPSFKLPQQ